jgi:hypothetical protein
MAHKSEVNYKPSKQIAGTWRVYPSRSCEVTFRKSEMNGAVEWAIRNPQGGIG